MIPTILIVAGTLIILISSIWLVRILLSPLVVKWRSIRGEVELIDTGAVKKKRKQDRLFLGSLATVFILIGVFLTLSGWAWGYNIRGDGFWLNQYLSGDNGISEKWDRISDDGDFVSQDGTEYPYYLLVRGDKYEFCGEPCESIVELREKLSKIKPENTVMIIDSFAVSSKIKEAKVLLNEMRISYEMEEIQ